jgi:hypothetical protein
MAAGRLQSDPPPLRKLTAPLDPNGILCGRRTESVHSQSRRIRWNSPSQSLTDVTFSNTLISSKGAIAPDSSAEETSLATFGHLGLSYAAAGVYNQFNCPSMCDNVQSGSVLVRSFDTLFVSGATTEDRIRFQVALEGGIRLLANPQAGPSGDSITYTLFDQSGSPFSYGADCSAGGACGASIFLDLDKYVYVPLSAYLAGGTYTTLDQRLDGSFSCFYATTIPCEAQASFYDSALIGNAAVVDANGNIVPGATIVSSSGFDYTQPLKENTVPEPSSISLLGIGLAAVLLSSRRLSPGRVGKSTVPVGC